MQQTLTIGLEGLGRRADVAVLDVVRAALGREDIPRQAVIDGLRAGIITINKQHIKPSAIVTPGDTVAFDDMIFAVADSLVPNTDIVAPLIIYADAEIIVVNKPAGMQVHPTIFGSGETLVHILLAQYPEIVRVGDDLLRPGIVHRLDRDTSGVMVVARTQQAWQSLKEAFHNHYIQKVYYGLVYGNPLQKKGSITYPIARRVQGDGFIAMRTERDYVVGKKRDAQTNYSVIHQYQDCALVRFVPKTGRTHQIRVHMHAIGHPFVGDPLYTSRAYENLFSSTRGQCLHAQSIAWKSQGKTYAFAVPLPKTWPIQIEIA